MISVSCWDRFKAFMLIFSPWVSTAGSAIGSRSDTPSAIAGGTRGAHSPRRHPIVRGTKLTSGTEGRKDFVRARCDIRVSCLDPVWTPKDPQCASHSSSLPHRWRVPASPWEVLAPWDYLPTRAIGLRTPVPIMSSWCSCRSAPLSATPERFANVSMSSAVSHSGRSRDGGPVLPFRDLYGPP